MANIFWFQAACCGGETHSLLNADQPDVTAWLETAKIRFLGHPYLRDTASSSDFAKVAEDCIEGRTPLDILIVEGAVSNTPEHPTSALIARLAARAGCVAAAGTCASFSGLLTLGSPKSDWVGLQYCKDRFGGLLGETFRSRSGLPVINTPGCPVHPDWITGTLCDLVSDAAPPLRLDRYNRPRRARGPFASSRRSRPSSSSRRRCPPWAEWPPAWRTRSTTPWAPSSCTATCSSRGHPTGSPGARPCRRSFARPIGAKRSAGSSSGSPGPSRASAGSTIFATLFERRSSSSAPSSSFIN